METYYACRWCWHSFFACSPMQTASKGRLDFEVSFALSWIRSAHHGRDRRLVVLGTAHGGLRHHKAQEKVLIESAEAIAAPNLLYLKNAPGTKRTKVGVYYLATEIYPHR